MAFEAILAEAEQLHNVSNRLEALAKQHPPVSEALMTISGNVRDTVTVRLLPTFVDFMKGCEAGADRSAVGCQGETWEGDAVAPPSGERQTLTAPACRYVDSTSTNSRLARRNPTRELTLPEILPDLRAVFQRSWQPCEAGIRRLPTRSRFGADPLKVKPKPKKSQKHSP
jgi:hypothetical protein